MNKQQFAEQFGRWVEPNEIIIENDNRKFGDYALRIIGNVLSWKGYKLEYWKAQGQKSYHVHIKDIPFIDGLSSEQNRKYKELFLDKYIQKMKETFEFENEEWLNDFDYKVCGKHRIAEENKRHYKYGTEKKLIAVINEELTNKAERDLYDQVIKEIPEERKTIIPNPNSITSQIVAKVSILDLARRFGFQVRGNMAVCKFHADKNPSLSFNDEKGLFYCFGCCVGGNIVDFYALCRRYGYNKK